MNDNKLVSVIIPVYKVEKYLDRCLESIVNQTYRNLEIILVDDGSPDNCPAMCDEWARKDKRIKVVHKKNGGVSSARNAGIDAATGEYLTFVDSDDTVNLNFSNFINYALESGCDICYSDFLERRYFREHYIGLELSDKNIRTLLKNNYTVSCWGKLYRLEFLRSNKIYFLPITNGEDMVFSFELLLHARNLSVYCDNIYNYTIVEGSASKTYKYKNYEAIFRATKHIFAMVDESHKLPKTKKQIKSFVANSVYYMVGIIGRFEGDFIQYYELAVNNKCLFVKPSMFKYRLLYVCIKIFGLKIAMRLFKLIIK